MNAILLAMLLRGTHALASDPSGALWEETVTAQQTSGYHPMIRFGSWDITRFNRPSTYMFATPDMVQQGQFEARGNQYFFRAVMANELENADKAKLMADMDPESARRFDQSYARSMSNFEGNYDDSTGTLYISYPVQGTMRTYALHVSTEGDDQRQDLVSDAERGMPGLWHTPEPYPDKLDARTRAKVEEDGLAHFAREAAVSDGAQFGLLDLRVDKTFRIHGKVGTWTKRGSTLILSAGNQQMEFQVSGDGTKLLVGGRAIYVR